ncbi:MAG: triple tyrosine motif-containing protein, partial [Bacteroidota bacterium]
VYQDNEGNVWFGSNLGLTRLRFSGFQHIDPEDGLGRWLHFFAEDNAGNVYIMGENVLKKWDGNELTDFLPEIFMQGKVVLTAMRFAPNGDIYLGSNAGDIYYARKGKLKGEVDLMGDKRARINDIRTLPDGRVFAGNGAYLYELKEGKVVHRFASVQPDKSRTGKLAYDQKGGLWMGMNYLDGDALVSHAADDPVVGLGTYDVESDSKGNIYFAFHESKLCRYDGKKWRAYHLKKYNLASHRAYCLITDHNDDLWLATARGLDHLRLDEDGEVLQVNHYGYEEGFHGLEAGENSTFCDSKGRIWVSTIRGVTFFHPDDLTRNEFPPQIHIREVQLDFETVDWTQYADSIEPYSDLPVDLKLPHDENHLTFRFSGINIKSPENVSYSYHLEGQGEKWSPPIAEEQVTFSNIAPGSYTFKVKAGNGDGVWNEVPA